MEKYLFAALFVAFFAYAARVGLASCTLDFKGLAALALGYAVVFAAASVAGDRLVGSGLFSLARYGVYLHVAVAVGLLAWSLLSWGRGERGPSYLLLVPCPFCLITILFSVLAASSLLGKGPLEVGAVSLLLFLAMVLFFRLLGRVFSVGPWEVMMGAALYYIVLLACAGYYRETVEVYRMGLHTGFSVPHGAWAVLGAAVAVLLFGFFRGMRLNG